MTNVFFWSDQHLHHSNILKFKNEDGSPVRPFSTLEEMHETLIANHNSVVQPGDKCYWLGDISFKYGPELGALMRRFNGKKRLIIGNHDRVKGTNLFDYFEKVHTLRHWKEPEGSFWISHIPIQEDSFRHKAVGNLHGHLHGNLVRDKWGKPDPRYKNVSVEQINHTPVSLDEIKIWLRGLK